jgi:HK97 family phage major capsid protein
VSQQTGAPCGHLSTGRLIAGLVTGDMRDCEQERRAMSEQVGSSGGFTIPSLVYASLVDSYRNESIVLQAGATVYPMETENLRIVMVTGDPSATIVGENIEIPESQGVFAALNLSAKKLGAVVRISRELFDDAPVLAAELEVQLSKIMALGLDSLCLYGTGAGGQPLGLRNTPGLQVVSAGTNGATPTFGLLLSAMQALETANAKPPFTLAYNPHVKYEYESLQDGMGVYFSADRLPASINALQRITSNQIPQTETQGDSNVASTMFLGQWANVAVGIRQQMRVEISTEAAGAFKQSQVLVKATLRFDTGLIRPYALAMVNGVL